MQRLGLQVAVALIIGALSLQSAAAQWDAALVAANRDALHAYLRGDVDAAKHGLRSAIARARRAGGRGYKLARAYASLGIVLADGDGDHRRAVRAFVGALREDANFELDVEQARRAARKAWSVAYARNGLNAGPGSAQRRARVSPASAREARRQKRARRRVGNSSALAQLDPAAREPAQPEAPAQPPSTPAQNEDSGTGRPAWNALSPWTLAPEPGPRASALEGAPGKTAPIVSEFEPTCGSGGCASDGSCGGGACALMGSNSVRSRTSQHHAHSAVFVEVGFGVGVTSLTRANRPDRLPETATIDRAVERATDDETGEVDVAALDRELQAEGWNCDEKVAANGSLAQDDCAVHVNPGLSSEPIFDFALGYHALPRLALALTALLQLHHGPGPMAGKLIGARAEILVTELARRGLQLATLAGVGVGTLHAQPRGSDHERPRATNANPGGIGASIAVGAKGAYRTNEHFAFGITPLFNIGLPNLLLDMGLTAGIELAF